MTRPLRAMAIVGLMGAIVLATPCFRCHAQIRATTRATSNVLDVLRAAAASETLPSRLMLHADAETLFPSRADNYPATEESAHYDYCQDGIRTDLTIAETSKAGGRVIFDRITRGVSADGDSVISRQADAAMPATVKVSYFPHAPRALLMPLHNDSIGGFLDGWPGWDEEPLPQLLLESGVARIDGTDTIAGRACLKVSAETKYGDYGLWISPADGYRIYAASCDKEPGDLTGSGKSLPMPWGKHKVVSMKYSISDVVYENVQTSRFPIAGRLQTERIFDDGSENETVLTVKRSRIEINPTTFPAGTFTMNGIANGMPVSVVGRPADDHSAYVWKDGKPVADGVLGIWPSRK